MKEFDVTTFLPVYYNTSLNYATIRFRFYDDDMLKLIPRDIYTITFNIKKINKNNKEYINCFIERINLLKKADPVDTGTTLELGL